MRRSETALEEPERIRVEIDRARAEVADSLGALRDRVVARLDWRGFVRRNPEGFVVAFFALGFLLGQRRRLTRSNDER